MALIVENGTGLPNAESYCSVAEASSYFSLRGNEAWADVENKEAALRKATDYMMARYGSRWLGYRATTTQALDWPRRSVPLQDQSYVYAFLPENQVPEVVKRACAELAFLASSTDLQPNLERAESSVTVGDISVTYDQSSPQSPRYPYIDSMLTPYLQSGMNVLKLVR